MLQTDINMMFGDRDVFLSMLNPFYFLNVLGKRGKSVLEKLLPCVSHEEILSEFPEKLQEEMRHEEILAPEVYLKNKRFEIKEKEELLIYLQGQVDMADYSDRDLRRKQDAIASRLDFLNDRLIELSGSAREDILNEASLVTANDYINQSSVQVEKLYQQYHHIRNIFSEADKGYQCPYCFQKVDEKNIDLFKNTIRLELDQCIKDGKLAKAELKRITEKKAQIDAILCEKAGVITEKDVYEKLLQNPRDFNEQILECEATIAKLRKQVDNALVYIGKRNEMLFRGLKLNKVKIILHEFVKTTGEIKDTFGFTYEDKDYNRLSYSEQVKAGTEIAELLKQLTGRKYPTIIDNAESICKFDNVILSGQIIFAVVVKGKELKVLKKTKAEMNEIKKEEKGLKEVA